MQRVSIFGAAICLSGSLLLSGPACISAAAAGSADNGNASSKNMQQAKQDALHDVNTATAVVKTMEQDKQLESLMKKAKGIFILTKFGRGAFIVGGRGGSGVMMVHKPDGEWGSPVFYSVGGASIGFQAGGAGGQAAFLLMNDNAVNHFKSANNFSLNAGAGLSIVKYSANGQTSWGKGDIIFWTNTGGAYAGATVGITDIVWDSNETRAFYDAPNLKEDAVFQGKVNSSQDDKLQRALPM